jgi:hypothetical protein
MYKWVSISLFFGFAAVSLLFFNPGCEEVLEDCSPCGEILSGDVYISGDPRIDGTFESLQRIRLFVERSTARYQEDLEGLYSTFDLPSETSMEQVVVTIKTDLFEKDGVDAVIGIEPAQCWIDSTIAAAALRSCEERLDCNISKKCRNADTRVVCQGLFFGDCKEAACDGKCFEDDDADAGSLCGGECIGACAVEDEECPGLCVGVCSGQCSAYNATGDCQGTCAGNCSGTCESTKPLVCEGICNGSCGQPTNASVETADGGIESCNGDCLGHCDGETAGKAKCRGHISPTGCDVQCDDCAEMAKLLGWASMECDSATVRIGLEISEDIDEQTRQEIVAKTRVVERVLQRAANDYAYLALLVDGIDSTGMLNLEDLRAVPGEESGQMAYLMEEALDSGVTDEYESRKKQLKIIDGREYLPLPYLRSRVGWLELVATGGAYDLTANAVSCVRPALENATGLLDEMIPVVLQGEAELVVDRSCGSVGDAARAPCAYSILDGRALLLSLVGMVNESF